MRLGLSLGRRLGLFEARWRSHLKDREVAPHLKDREVTPHLEDREVTPHLEDP